jgi:hypothetical protein
MCGTEASDSQKSTPSSSSKFLDADSENLRTERIPDTQYSENYIGTSLKMVLLINATNSLAKDCSGNFVIRRNNIVQKRLSLQVAVTCTEKKNCTTWNGG